MTQPARPLLDGDSTTIDWQTTTTRIAILPIGAFEQHGGRLPLRTDTLLAEHFAERLARSLGAALLPAIAYATSIEHTGFRGSLSLRPETAMAVVRDLIDGLERQHFRRLIVVNGHGGNFFLGPVLRDINSQDRAIKAIAVDCSGPFETSAEGRCMHHGELHAGAAEISSVLAIRPDLVGPPGAALPLAGTPDPRFQRSDFNTFGVGVRDPSGVWGDPAGGDAQIGQAMNDSIAANQLAHVRERLAWLEARPGYAGAGGIAIRPLVAEDIADGLRLCRAAGWNQRDADWRLFLGLQPDGGSAAVRMGAVVGTVTTLLHGPGHGWIGMVLVDPGLRRMGIGTRLLRSALDRLAGCPSVGLDATPSGKLVYDQLGFVDRHPLVRMVRRHGAPPAASIPSGVRPMTSADLAAAVAMDADATGMDRSALLRWLHRADPSRAWIATGDSGAVTGIAFGRAGETFDSIGPVIASDCATAVVLLQAALAGLDGRPAGLDIHPHPEWQRCLERNGFVVERRFIRMVRGQAPTERSDRLFAIAGPELG
jgi:creatinine amidohydrolase